MNEHTQYHREQQEEKRQHDRISFFPEALKVGALPSGSGIRNRRGVKSLTMLPCQ
ncbi:MAG: hypothetical protein FWD79_06335 [Desulfobulbus sp.]|nr:hypothetical protein [Desulfobulbus sp.]